MATERNKKSNFIMQAGILASAGIVVRTIGILYRTPLVAIIGDEGNGYYNTAYTIYTIILLISSYSIPSAISKVIAARLGVGEYKNAHRLFVGAILYVIIMGGIGSFVCFVYAGKLVGESSAHVLKIFAPTIFFSGLLGTLRGYFQAHQTMVFTSYSQIIEQIVNAAVSIGMAYVFVNALNNETETVMAIGGAQGSAIGTGAGVLIALAFMLLVYLVNLSSFRRKRKRDKTEKLLNPLQIAGIIFGMVTPVVLSTCIYNLSTAANLKIYQSIMQNTYGFSEAMATTSYGLFAGKAMQIINIPIAIASAMSSAIIPTIAHSHERGEFDMERQKIAAAIKATMLIAIPSTFGLLALSEPVTLLLYPQRMTYDIVSWLIKALCITVMLYGLSTLGNAILQGTGNVNIPVINAAIALVIQTGLLVVLLKYTALGLYALVIATVVYSFIMCILNGIAMGIKLKYKQEFKKTFLLPTLAALFMFAGAFLSNYLFVVAVRFINKNEGIIVTGISNVIRLLLSLAISIIIYGWLLLKFGAATEKEIKMLPKGEKLAAMLKRKGLLKEEKKAGLKKKVKRKRKRKI